MRCALDRKKSDARKTPVTRQPRDTSGGRDSNRRRRLTAANLANLPGTSAIYEKPCSLPSQQTTARGYRSAHKLGSDHENHRPDRRHELGVLSRVLSAAEPTFAL